MLKMVVVQDFGVGPYRWDDMIIGVEASVARIGRKITSIQVLMDEPSWYWVVTMEHGDDLEAVTGHTPAEVVAQLERVEA